MGAGKSLVGNRPAKYLGISRGKVGRWPVSEKAKRLDTAEARRGPVAVKAPVKGYGTIARLREALEDEEAGNS